MSKCADMVNVHLAGAGTMSLQKQVLIVLNLVGYLTE